MVQPFNRRTNVAITESIRQGDILLIGILARTAAGGIADGTGKLGISIQLNETPCTGFVDNVLTLAWTLKPLQRNTQASGTITVSAA